ncbi:MFS transporter [Dongia sp.]|uniref:MFS transporter n=1 Tax=Dongia sp. TaxID=1977262 RepID=UPI0035B07038
MAGLWRHADFRRLIAALGVSQMGAKVAREALPLTAVLVLGAGPMAMSGLTVAASLPTLLMALHAGAFLDRVRRRPAMIVADLIRFLVLISVPIAALFGALSIGQLVIVAFFVSAATLAFDIADQAYLPGLVGKEEIVQANSLKEAADAATEIVGPPVGGILVQTIGGPFTILIDAVSYLVSALFLGRIRADEPRSTPRAEVPNITHEIKAGLSVLWHDSVLRPLLYARFIRTFFGGMLGPFYVLYAVTDLGLTPLQLGLVVAVGGAASLLGSAAVPKLVTLFTAGPGLILAFAVKSLGLACVPLAGHALGLGPYAAILLLIAQQILADGSTGYFMVVERSLRQRRVPAELLARAGATTRLVNDAPIPFAALIGGLIAEQIGVHAVMWIAVAGYALSPVVAFLSDVRRLNRI